MISPRTFVLTLFIIFIAAILFVIFTDDAYAWGWHKERPERHEKPPKEEPKEEPSEEREERPKDISLGGVLPNVCETCTDHLPKPEPIEEEPIDPTDLWEQLEKLRQKLQELLKMLEPYSKPKDIKG